MVLEKSKREKELEIKQAADKAKRDAYAAWNKATTKIADDIAKEIDDDVVSTIYAESIASNLNIAMLGDGWDPASYPHITARLLESIEGKIKPLLKEVSFEKLSVPDPQGIGYLSKWLSDEFDFPISITKITTYVDHAQDKKYAGFKIKMDPDAYAKKFVDEFLELLNDSDPDKSKPSRSGRPVKPHRSGGGAPPGGYTSFPIYGGGGGGGNSIIPIDLRPAAGNPTWCDEHGCAGLHCAHKEHE